MNYLEDFFLSNSRLNMFVSKKLIKLYEKTDIYKILLVL